MNWLSRLSSYTVVIAFSMAIEADLYAQVEAKAQHHRYQIVDLGPAGGPNSAMSTGAITINRHGRAVGSADLALHDPYDPNCFNFDCFVTHAYSWKNGRAA